MAWGLLGCCTLNVRRGTRGWVRQGGPPPPHAVVRGGAFAARRARDQVVSRQLPIRGIARSPPQLSFPGGRRADAGRAYTLTPPSPAAADAHIPPSPPPPSCSIRLWAGGSVLRRALPLPGVVLPPRWPAAVKLLPFFTTSVGRAAPIAAGGGGWPCTRPRANGRRLVRLRSGRRVFAAAQNRLADASDRRAGARRQALPCPLPAALTTACCRRERCQRHADRGRQRPSRHAACFLAPPPGSRRRGAVRAAVCCAPAGPYYGARGVWGAASDVGVWLPPKPARAPAHRARPDARAPRPGHRPPSAPLPPPPRTGCHYYAGRVRGGDSGATAVSRAAWAVPRPHQLRRVPFVDRPPPAHPLPREAAAALPPRHHGEWPSRTALPRL